MDIAPIGPGSSSETPAAVPAAQQMVNRELISAAHTVNASGFFGQDSELTFALDRATQRPVIRIVNRQTNELIRQIPAEYVLRLAEVLRVANPGR
ncbi:MAG TPA: flagellar protein FlaG [Bryobacteraceae bacterium]|nr:flagellar protein FlaG [Bryobacteraceae bacterium]